MLYKHLLSFFTVMIISYSSFSYADSNELTEECYAKAMIGYDSVINSRVGLYPEKSIHITNNSLPDESPLSRINLLRTIMGAYLWGGTPHAYAVKTFGECLIKFEK